MLSELQQFCLNHMGMTIWQSRSPRIRYLVVNDKQTVETQTLLQKMIVALQWLHEETQVLTIEQAKQVDLAGFEKVLMCTDLQDVRFLENAGQVRVTIPALSTLLNNIEAKKQAWKAMQKLL